MSWFTKMVNTFLLPTLLVSEVFIITVSQNYPNEGLIMIKLTANFQEIMSTSGPSKMGSNGVWATRRQENV